MFSLASATRISRCRRVPSAAHRRLRTGIATGAAVILLVSPSAAQVRPRLIPFQGRVTTSAGAPLPDQAVTMTFAIYAQPEGQAEPLWSEILSSVPIRNSQVNVLLGQVTSIDDPAGNG